MGWGGEIGRHKKLSVLHVPGMACKIIAISFSKFPVGTLLTYFEAIVK